MTKPSDGQSRFWDVYSRTYDAIRFSIPYQRHLERIAGELVLRGGERVLDLGCATGNLEVAIARQTPSAHVVGVDYSEGMLRRAARKCGALPGVSFERADLRERLPFADASFDRVVANNVLYALEDKASLLAEVFRVLTPEGRLVLSDPKPGARVSSVVRAHFAALADMPLGRRTAAFVKTMVTLPLMGLAPMLLSAAVIGARIEKGEYHFSTAEELRALLAAFPTLTIASGYADQSWIAVGGKASATRIA